MLLSAFGTSCGSCVGGNSSLLSLVLLSDWGASLQPSVIGGSTFPLGLGIDLPCLGGFGFATLLASFFAFALCLAFALGFASALAGTGAMVSWPIGAKITSLRGATGSTSVEGRLVSVWIPLLRSGSLFLPLALVLVLLFFGIGSKVSSFPLSKSFSIGSSAFLRALRLGRAESSSQVILLFRLRGCFPVVGGISVTVTSEEVRLERYQSTKLTLNMFG